MIKLLALVHAGMSSHTIRIVEICKKLRETGEYTILFSGQGPWMSLVEQAGFDYIETPQMTKKELYDRLEGKVVSVVFDESNYDEFFENEKRLIEATGPDIILRDLFREMAGVASKLDGCRTFDVYLQKVPLSPYYHFDFRPDQLPRLFDVFPKGTLRPLARILEKHFRLQNSKYIRKKVTELGLNEHLAIDGVRPDLTLFPDSEHFFDLDPQETQNCEFLGPILGKGDMKKPQWLDKFISDPRKKIVITRGTTCQHEEPRLLAQTFSQTNYAVALHTHHPIRLANVFGGEPFDLDLVLPHADIFITHGGTGSTYKGIKHKVPMIVLYDHFEQQINARQAVKKGIAISIPSQNRTPHTLNRAIREMVQSPEYQQNIEEMSEKVFAEDAVTKAAELIGSRYQEFVARRYAQHPINPGMDSAVST